MFCWGNTVHGELGLGGIEEEQILTPRELQFSSTNGVKQGLVDILDYIPKNHRSVLLTKICLQLHVGKIIQLL